MNFFLRYASEKRHLEISGLCHAEDKIYELADLKGHSKEEDCWLVIDGEVYDVTTFLDEHPGGFDIILASTGLIPCSILSAFT